MEPWNAIVTARGDRLPQARRVPRALGRVERTGFYNVLAMNADDPEHLIDRLERLFADPDAIVLIETISGRADMHCSRVTTIGGVRCWPRTEARS